MSNVTPWGHTPDIWTNTCYWMLLGRTAFLLSLPSYFANYDVHKHPCRVLESSDREKTGRMWLQEGNWEEHWDTDYGETWHRRWQASLTQWQKFLTQNWKWFEPRLLRIIPFLVLFLSLPTYHKQNNWIVFDRVSKDKLKHTFQLKTYHCICKVSLDSLTEMPWWRRQVLSHFPYSYEFP